MTSLEVEIRRIIAVDGPISVARYMALCLGHPVHGYYQTRDPFGRAGDFTTAPEIDQMFGELIGLWAASVWRQMGAPQPIRLVELGPGRGTLMADALRAAKVVPDFVAGVSVDLVETSAPLRRRQSETLAHCGVPITWHASLADVQEAPLIVIANEFFDALPVHQAVKSGEHWHERMVGLGEDGALTFGLGPDPLAGFEAILPENLRDAPSGAIYEWRSDPVAIELAARVVRHDGAALVIDYGHVRSGLGDTLQALGRHRRRDVFDLPGEIDLTAHVDFAALAATAMRAGAGVHGPTPQGEFLRRLGIDVRASRLKQGAPDRAAEIDAALRRLTAAGADGMGTLFKVVCLSDRRLETLPGFG